MQWPLAYAAFGTRRTGDSDAKVVAIVGPDEADEVDGVGERVGLAMAWVARRRRCRQVLGLAWRVWQVAQSKRGRRASDHEAHLPGQLVGHDSEA